MANLLDVQKILDGDRNLEIKVVAIADTSNFTDEVIVDISTLSPTRPPTTQVSIAEIEYSIQDGWVVYLYWEAGVNKLIAPLAGRGIFPVAIGLTELQNDAGSGKTGNVLLSTHGWTTGTLAFTLVIHFIKQAVEADEGDIFLLAETGDEILTEGGDAILV